MILYTWQSFPYIPQSGDAGIPYTNPENLLQITLTASALLSALDNKSELPDSFYLWRRVYYQKHLLSYCEWLLSQFLRYVEIARTPHVHQKQNVLSPLADLELPAD